MKLIALLVVVGFVAVQVSEARMSAFACSGDCYVYDESPFCLSDGSVACDNCERDAKLCADDTLTVLSTCNKSC